jgi:NADH:ubiquinone oxidoreductase subunit C
MSFYSKNSDHVLQSHYSCFLTSERITVNAKVLKNIKTVSTLFRSTLWVERELQEFFLVNFENLKDSRRLLTDYTYQKLLNNRVYKTDSFDLISQNVYIRVLH